MAKKPILNTPVEIQIPNEQVNEIGEIVEEYENNDFPMTLGDQLNSWQEWCDKDNSHGDDCIFIFRNNIENPIRPDYRIQDGASIYIVDSVIYWNNNSDFLEVKTYIQEQHD